MAVYTLSLMFMLVFLVTHGEYFSNILNTDEEMLYCKIAIYFHNTVGQKHSFC